MWNDVIYCKIRIAWIQLGRGHILHLWRQHNRGANTHQQQYQPKVKRTTWLMNLRVCRSFWDLAHIVGSWKGTDWVSVVGVTETIGYHSPETWKTSLVVPWAIRVLFSGNDMWQRNTIHLVPWFSHFKPQFMIIYVCMYIYIGEVPASHVWVPGDWRINHDQPLVAQREFRLGYMVKNCSAISARKIPSTPELRIGRELGTREHLRRLARCRFTKNVRWYKGDPPE